MSQASFLGLYKCFGNIDGIKIKPLISPSNLTINLSISSTLASCFTTVAKIIDSLKSSFERQSSEPKISLRECSQLTRWSAVHQKKSESLLQRKDKLGQGCEHVCTHGFLEFDEHYISFEYCHELAQ